MVLPEKPEQGRNTMNRYSKRTIVVAGHICLDITPVFAGQSSKLYEVLVPGKLITMKGVDIHTGGAVANTGLALKILGADVTLMGKLGKDAFGQLVLSALDPYGVSKNMSVSDDSETSYSVVLAPPGIDRIFLHNPGANDTFGINDLDFQTIEKASLFHFGYPPLMKRMYENHGQQLLEIFKKVKQFGIATSLDMAAVDDESEAGKADWAEITQKILPYVDFFVPSAEELAFMINRPLYERWRERAKGKDITGILSIEDEISPLGQQLIDWGAAVVLIKCGSRGLYFRSADTERLIRIGARVPSLVTWANAEAMEECYKPTAVISGTGAGDTTIAAFLYAMLEGYDWNRCLKLSSATGACCVETYDALSGICSLDQLNQKIDMGWEKQRLQLNNWVYDEGLKYWSPPR